jgi:hypothetical protein
MNWIFEIYGDTYKALMLQSGRRKPSPLNEQEPGKPLSGHPLPPA